MSGTIAIVLGVLGCLAGATAAAATIYLRGDRHMRARRREAALQAQGVDVRLQSAPSDLQSIALRYAESMTRRLFTEAIEPLSPSVRAKRAEKTRSGKRYLEQSVAAGCRKRISTSGYCEARARLTCLGGLAGALFGALFSAELAVLLAVAGLAGGASVLPRAINSLRRSRALCAERHLSEMLEVVALGLRSGLTFDRSFALYGSHFDNEFAQACASSYRKWSLGLVDREDALRELAASFDCPQLARVIDSILRGLRFGSSITSSLEEAAAQSRAAYRTALEERVAKAPVKMMLPTGTLILPAMLLLVMGPVLLELAGGFK